MRSSQLGTKRIGARSASITFAAIMLLAPSTPASAQTSRTAAAEGRRAERTAKLDADHFYRTTQLIDDDLSTVAEINTRNGFTWRGRFTDRVRSDNYLRALVGKSAGRTIIQVYQTITYSGPNRRFLSASYRTPAGPVSAEIEPLDAGEQRCIGSVCVWEDHVAFKVPEEVLRKMAAEPDPLPWRFRFQSQSSEHWDDNMPRAEILGLLKRLDEYRARAR